jgi:hypothetical protein
LATIFAPDADGLGADQPGASAPATAVFASFMVSSVF